MKTTIPDQSRELLLESAPLALRLAATHCESPVYADQACGWYHGIWPYFRLLGAVASPWMQYSFYASVLRPLSIPGGRLRILITGTADYAMLELVHHIYQDQPIDLDVTIIDRCRTPLELSRWFAERHGFEVETEVADILNYENARSFDLICTHSFFGNFNPRGQVQLVSKWAALLRSGGKLVSVNRVRPGQSGPNRYTPDQADRFIARLRDNYQHMGEELDLPWSQLEQRARLYTALYTSYPLESVDRLANMFSVNAFTMESLELEGSEVSEQSGPSAGDRGARACFVFTRL